MSLKDAIREAVDERHKQEENLARQTAATEPPTKTLTVSKAQADLRQNPTSEAVNTASNKAVFTAKLEEAAQPKDEIGEEAVETAAMTVRVPRQHRIHWLISAKREGTSLTVAITEALNARFGEPGQKDG